MNKQDPLNRKYDPEETKRLMEEMKKRTEIMLMEHKVKMEVERKHCKKRAWFDAAFPEFRDVPIAWLIIGVGCVLFELFTLII